MLEVIDDLLTEGILGAMGILLIILGGLDDKREDVIRSGDIATELTGPNDGILDLDRDGKSLFSLWSFNVVLLIVSSFICIGDGLIGDDSIESSDIFLKAISSFKGYLYRSQFGKYIF